MKKSLRFIFIFVFVFWIVFTCFSDKTNIQAFENDKIYYENCNNSIRLHKKVIEYFYEKENTRSINSEKSYNDNYCGSFIDSNGFLNIGYKEQEDFPKFDTQVLYFECEFSYNYLIDLKNEIINKVSEFNISSLSLDEENNRIIIYMTNSEFIDDLKLYLQEKNMYNEAAIEVRIDENSIGKYKSKIAYGGDGIQGRGLIQKYDFGTICMNVYDNDTGKYGVLTNEHVATKYISMYHNGEILEKIGDSEKTRRDGRIDAAFVPFQNQEKWSVTTNARYGNEIFDNIKLGDESLIIQGAPIKKIGQESGVTSGRIISTSWCGRVGFENDPNQLLFIDIIEVSNETLGGDSGGPIYYDAGDYWYLIAMTFAGSREESTIQFGLGCNIFKVLEQMNLTPVLEGEVFETTNLAGNEIRIDNLVPTLSSTSSTINFEIPSHINDRVVSQIGFYALSNQPNITKYILPDTLEYIDDSAFANCSSLEEIKIPDTVTYIGAFAFEGCTNLKSITLSSNLIYIGDYAFENCSSLETIDIPNTVSNIEDYAFKNCLSLQTIKINKDDNDITELGMNAFLGCSSLETINVPSKRILEYMNATNWKNHKSKIESDALFEEVDINCSSDVDSLIAINPSENGILKININCYNSYKITVSSDYYIIIKLYDSNMQEINISPTMSSNECSGVISRAFPKGTYYIGIKYTSNTMDGEVTINIKVNEGINNYFEYGSNDVIEHLHSYDNQLKNSSVYHNNQGAGLYKVSISGNLQSYQNVLTIYDNSNKNEPMKRIETSLYELDARTSMARNNLVVLFQNYTSYYIDIVIPRGTYNTLTLTIEKIEGSYEIDLVNGNQTTYNIMSEETIIGDHFVMLEILEPTSISVIYDYTGTQDEFIYFVLFKEVYNNNESQYEMQLVFPEMMVTYGESLEWRSTITAGRHYIGYFNKLNPNSTISITITN